MVGYLWKQLRHRRRSPLLFLLTVVGVALGVASVVTIQLLNRAAVAAFEETLEINTAAAGLIVRPYGPTLDETVLPAILATRGVEGADPLHETSVRLGAGSPESGARHLTVLGIDLLSGRVGSSIEMGAAIEAGDLVSAPGIALPEATAADLGLREGDEIVLGHGSRLHRISVAGVLPGGQASGVMDIAWSQDLFGPDLTQINVHLAPGVEAASVASLLQPRLGPGVRITTPTEEGLEGRGLLSAFRLNLTALSLISVFVGAFLVYGTTRATLVRRRGELGVLRSLGATRSQVLVVVLAEIAFLGVAGVLVGLPAGYLAARANVETVSGTLTNLYLLEAINELTVPTWVVALAVAVGVGSALLGGVLPALETVGSRIRSLLSSVPQYAHRELSPAHLAIAGVAVGAAALGVLFLSRWTHRGMVSAFLLMIALPLATPRVLDSLAQPFHPKRLGVAYAVRSLSHRLASAGVAVAGLAVAVTMMVGITVMVASFRASLSSWIEGTVRADIYVSAAAWRGDRDAPGLQPEVLDALREVEGVRVLDRVRGFTGRAEGTAISLRGVDLRQVPPSDRFQVLAGPAEPSTDGDGVYVSEPLARKAGLSPGDTIRLETPAGAAFPVVVSIVRDYGDERGAVTMDLTQMTRWFGPGDVHGAALYLEASEGAADTDPVLADLRDRLGGYGLTIRSNRALRDNALRVFDQTFRITLVLQAMALLIAAVGVTLTLLVLGHDEAGTLALYRALGATRPQVFAVFTAKGAVIALAGTALGFVGGSALAALLIYVVNPTYFGWSLEPHVPVGQLLAQAAWIQVAAVLAGVIPALGASRPTASALNPVEA